MAGTKDNDILRGTAGADTLSGGAGRDAIYGFDGERAGASVGKIEAIRVGSGLDGALFAGTAPGRPNELFIVRKDAGTIDILDPDSGRTTRFLDIPDTELTTGGEQGLLGLAFHPGYARNGRFFVHLVNNAGDIEIREYARAAGNADRADPVPVSTLITVAHPDYGNHNGGSLAFSPRDGYLYISLGDGGGANDPDGNGQNPNTLLGSILRLDPDRDGFPGDPARSYRIPGDNPFVGEPGADEVWAYGLRNPWRISFDERGGLYIADVGQNAREEINFQRAGSAGGKNYGWDLVEGTLGTPPPGATPPVFQYDHTQGRSVTGGHVYQGAEESLDGSYFFADFISNEIWTLDVRNGDARNVTLRTGQTESSDAPLQGISSFGLDGNDELYAVTLSGDIFRLDMAAHSGDVADALRGGRGADRLFGGPGDDRLFGGSGSDLARGGFGDDKLFGGGARDQLAGNAGEDALFGGSGRDVLRGGRDADTLRGNRGADTLDGQRGDDDLRGGGGADVFVFAPRCGNDAVADFTDDTDRLDLTAFGFSGFSDVSARSVSGATVIDLGAGSVRLDGFDFASLDASDVLL